MSDLLPPRFDGAFSFPESGELPNTLMLQEAAPMQRKLLLHLCSAA